MEWIKIENQRPPFEQRVLICIDGEVDTAYLSPGGVWRWDMMHLVPRDRKITYWAELPPPPPNEPLIDMAQHKKRRYQH